MHIHGRIFSPLARECYCSSILIKDTALLCHFYLVAASVLQAGIACGTAVPGYVGHLIWQEEHIIRLFDIYVGLLM
jgi:hypothetical protein